MHEAVSIIIPAYNEAASIQQVLGTIRSVLDHHRIPHEILVVDDGSSDDTARLAELSGVRVMRHRKNMGYGASLKTGIRAARYERICITDADGTYPETAIPEILSALDTADMAVGARTRANVHIPLIRRPAKWVLRRLAAYITGEDIPDLNSGLRAFRRSFALQYFSLLPDKFSFTTTITVAAHSDHYKVTYIPIEYRKRQGRSKIVAWDFVNFLSLVLRLSMSFNPLKVFVPVSLLCFVLGGIKLVLDVVFAFLRGDGLMDALFLQPVVSTTALILLLSGLQILLIGMMTDGLSRKIALRVPIEYQSYGARAQAVESVHPEAVEEV